MDRSLARRFELRARAELRARWKLELVEATLSEPSARSAVAEISNARGRGGAKTSVHINILETRFDSTLHRYILI